MPEKNNTQTIQVSCCQRIWQLSRPQDLESLWDKITPEEFNPDERLPYWVELWPASLALAELLQNKKADIAGKTCLDIGCGIGFTAIVASWLGAKVIGMDYEPEALAYARQNAFINSVPPPLWVGMDWRQPAIKAKSCTFIFGGDIMYEKRFVEPVFTFLDYALAENGCVWVAEPARNVYGLFQEMLKSKGWESHCISKQKVAPLHVQKSQVSVNLWELRRKPTNLVE